MSTTETKKRKVLQGTVVSDKMTKTRVISVERLVKHPKYEKVMKKTSRLYAHDETNQSGEGDIVEVASMKPLSKLKRWQVIKVVVKAKK